MTDSTQRIAEDAISHGREAIDLYKAEHEVSQRLRDELINAHRKQIAMIEAMQKMYTAASALPPEWRLAISLRFNTILDELHAKLAELTPSGDPEPPKPDAPG